MSNVKYITGPGQATTQVVRQGRVCIVDAWDGKFLRFAFGA